MFHGPVRDGKGWDHLAMVIKRSLLNAQGLCRTCSFQSGKKRNSVAAHSDEPSGVFGVFVVFEYGLDVLTALFI